MVRDELEFFRKELVSGFFLTFFNYWVNLWLKHVSDNRAQQKLINGIARRDVTTTHNRTGSTKKLKKVH